MLRIDVHSHLLPGVDDGCADLEQSLACARLLAESGYGDCICTPHIWPSNPRIDRVKVPLLVAQLQEKLDRENIPLRLWSGGELNLHASVTKTPTEKLIDVALNGKHILVDLWADKLPAWFDDSIAWLESLRLKVILAHPERMRAVQDEPELVQRFVARGILLQGNLQCFADRIGAHTRRTAELLLEQDAYFMLGSDTHDLPGLRTRMVGLQNAIALAGEEKIDRLTKTNPATLLPA